ncbi:M20 peptidase aminoacylase family protein [Halalkalibacter nanhaiisediminis]|uniref:Amidohydrolase n=1 Tax=Halalkalibacter nanhaiisediminis TaxID=688079 RepID=A0A562QN70_9BACI|nr:M20 peptidase aminoacylase family protein [Halalkalibacter nanhaiisediminis]TWI58202.1 amidohydrolase [Halalkalibacter nanhaiisediminis]
MIDHIKEWVDENKELLTSTYQYLHENAEISWKEINTTKYLCEQLDILDISYQTFEEHTGVIGFWGNSKKGPTVGIRAEIDALWQMVDGDWKANHSCGHDAHMTMVLYAITCLKKLGFTPNGLIKIIFQPAEETGKGAQALIEQGVMNDIDYLIGIHVRPIQELTFGQASPAIYHGATTLLKGGIKGIQAHGSRPNLGINVVDSLGSVIQAVNAVQVDPTVSASAKVTKVQAGGTNFNIIPDYGEFGIDIRAQENEVMDDLIKRIKQAVTLSGSANGAEIEVEALASMVAAESSPILEEIVTEAIIEALGEEALAKAPVTPGGEDFHFYKKSFPKIQATMVGLGTDLNPGLHHPNMSFNLDSLQNGVKILSTSIVKLLNNR